MKYELSRSCPNNITAVTSVTRATQPGSDETGVGPAVSDSTVYAISQMAVLLNGTLPQVPRFVTDLVQIFCNLQTSVLNVILEKKNKNSGLLLQKNVKYSRWREWMCLVFICA